MLLTGGLLSLLVFFVGMAVFIVALVFAILFTISRLTGWRALAETYRPLPETNRGVLLEEKTQRQMYVGAVRYRGTVRVRCYTNGLELTGGLLEPPLFIPWHAIRDYQRQNMFPFPQGERFTVDGRTIRLSNRLEELEKRFGPRP